MSLILTESTTRAVCSLVDELPRGKFWLAGGAILRVIEGKPPADLDLYFRSETDCAAYQGELVAAGFERVAEGPPTFKRDGTTVQCIAFRCYETARAVIDSFDISICQLALDGDRLVATPEALEDINTKRPRFVTLVNAPATLERVVKYSKRGYVFTRDSMRDLVEKIRDGEDQEGMSGS